MSNLIRNTVQSFRDVQQDVSIKINKISNGQE